MRVSHLIALGLAALPASAQVGRTRSSSTCRTMRRPWIHISSGIRTATRVYRNIFDNLVTRDTAGKIVPQIATAWRYKDDTTLEFEIREGVTFQDGSALTAEDVA